MIGNDERKKRERDTIIRMARTRQSRAVVLVEAATRARLRLLHPTTETVNTNTSDIEHSTIIAVHQKGRLPYC